MFSVFSRPITDIFIVAKFSFSIFLKTHHKIYTIKTLNIGGLICKWNFTKISIITINNKYLIPSDISSTWYFGCLLTNKMFYFVFSYLILDYFGEDQLCDIFTCVWTNTSCNPSWHNRCLRDGHWCGLVLWTTACKQNVLFHSFVFIRHMYIFHLFMNKEFFLMQKKQQKNKNKKTTNIKVYELFLSVTNITIIFSYF